MTNLEWINGQIEIFNRKINFLNNEVNHNGVIDPLEPNLTAEEIQMVLSHATQTLQILIQIKNELEAWEVVKEEITFDTDSYDCDDRSYTFEYAQFYTDNEEKLDKLHKTLEVKDVD